MNKPSQEDNKTSQENKKLMFHFDVDANVQFCNFNGNGELILFSTVRNFRNDYMNIVFVYSIQTKKSKCRKIYKVPNEAEIISISKDDKIWLRLNDDIYEWNLLTSDITIILKNVFNVNL